MLRAFVSENQKDWDEYLPYLTMAYRASRHESTKYTPNYLMLGREVNLPIDLVFSSPKHNVVIENVEFVKALREKFERAHARKFLKRNSERQKKNYDRNWNSCAFKVGDSVWLSQVKRKIGVSSKLSPMWHGPYLVHDKINDVLYKIKRNRRSKFKIVHVDHLKL